MTTKLEKQFFDTFGIEPKKIYLCPHCKTKLSGCTWVGDEQRFECLYSWGEHPYYMGKELRIYQKRRFLRRKRYRRRKRRR